ncbi:MAG: metallophosphoesterase [Candidatus ainarchaeum sp.]|nr:metallophosphoesterase [Candidatus ainarchaeum sp.]
MDNPQTEIELAKGLFLTSEGIAVFKKRGLAAASDLHIGFEEALGESLARMQTRMILEKFVRVCSRFKIKEILLNGDIKYTFGKESKQEWNEIDFFMRELRKKAELHILKGNHDFYLENMVRDLDMQVLKEYENEDAYFTHGDSEIEKKGKLVVIGNEHPSIKLRDEIGASKKYPCFLFAKKENVLVLPAVNPWAPGTDILNVDSRHFLSPLLRSVKLDDVRVYPLDGESIYDFKRVRDVRKLMLNNPDFGL